MDNLFIYLINMNSAERQKSQKARKVSESKADALRWTFFPGSNIEARHVIAPNFITRIRNAYELVYAV